MDIYFYKGTDGIDVDIEVVPETVKIGDSVRVFKSEKSSGLTTSQSRERIIKDILNTDLVDTDIYRGVGIDEINEKPVRWTKQKNDLQILGRLIPKSRSILEPQVYPTSKIIGDLNETSGIGVNGADSIFVDDAQSFFYESKYGLDLSASSVDALITSGQIGVGAAVTAIVSAAGTISSFDITNAGEGYDAATVEISIPTVGIGTYLKVDEINGATATAVVSVAGTISSINITNPGSNYITSPLITIGDANEIVTAEGVGIGSTATASATIGAGGVITSIDVTGMGSQYSLLDPPSVTIELPPAEVGIGSTATAISTVVGGKITNIDVVNPGLGYTHSNPPQVIVNLPRFKTEKITGIRKFEGFTGIITGITEVGGSALRFDFYAVRKNSDGGFTPADASKLDTGYPVYIKDTNVGNGLTSVNQDDDNVVGIGTTFLDNVYIVNSVTPPVSTSQASITCNVHSNSSSSISGIAQTGFYDPTNPGLTTSLGTINWGRLYSPIGNPNLKRSSNPISIGVTGLTVNTGLTTFPTIQRKSYDGQGETGHRNSGSIRAVISIT